MVNIEIRLIIFFEAKDGEVLYSQQKQDQELTVAQIMNSCYRESQLIAARGGKKKSLISPLFFLDYFYIFVIVE